MSSSSERYKSKPYGHQLKYLSLAKGRPAFALLAEMGVGKTKMVIDEVADLWSDQDINGLLVFAPNGVHTNWTKLELPRHMPDWVRTCTAAWRSAPNKKERAELDALNDTTDATVLRIFVMNWEALQTSKGFAAAEAFARSCSKLMIVGDETTMVKNPAAARTKALMKLKKYSKYRRIMNGTPVSNSPFDLFSQFAFLDDNILGTSSYYAFKAEYADMLQDGHPLLDAIKRKAGQQRFTPQVVARTRDGRPRYKNLEKLERLIAPHSYRVLKKECLDLPEKIYKTVLYKMTKEQQKAYDLMKEECRMLLEEEHIPVANKLVALGKLAQIASGYYLAPNSTEPVRIEGGSPKIELLKELAERVIGQGKKMIVWARYHVELDDVAEALKEFNCVKYDGRLKHSEREESKHEFQFGYADIFIGQQQSGGVGITLTAASTVCYFSNTFSLYDRLQSEDRAHRIGQEESVVYVDLVAEDSIEQKTLGVLRSKKNVADIITGDRALELL